MTRLDALKALLEKYGASVEDYDHDVEEDLRPYFECDDTAEVGRYCCVTVNYSSHGGAKFFFLPEFEDLNDAQDRAVEFMHDGIFEEIPVEVVDLDTGELHVPHVEWRALTPKPVADPTWSKQC